MIVLRVRARAQPASAARLVRARSLAETRLSLRKQSSGYHAKQLAVRSHDPQHASRISSTLQPQQSLLNPTSSKCARGRIRTAALSVGRMARRTDGDNRDNTGHQFGEENQRHREDEARAPTVTMAEGAPLADAAAATEAAAVLTERMDDSYNEQSCQSPPLGPTPPSLPPGPPEYQESPPYPDAPPSPPFCGLAEDRETAGPVANPPTPGVDLVDLAYLEDLSELTDEVAASAFSSFTPETASEPAVAISDPVQSESFFTHGPTTQAPHGVPMYRRPPGRVISGLSDVVAAHQHEMVASFLQHQHNSAGQTELAEDSYSSVKPEATQQLQFVPLQQHQYVPAPLQYNVSSSSSSLMSMAQQPSMIPKATQQHHQSVPLQQHQYVPAPLQYNSSSSLMSMAQQPSVMPEATQQHQFVTLQQHQFVPAPLQYDSSSSLMSMAQRSTPDAVYAQAHCATSVLAVAQNIVPTSLKEIFAVHVMCDYTPREPKQLPTSQWATLEELVSKLRQHAPMEVLKFGQQNLRQMITNWFKGHPNFRDLPFRAWGKRLKDNTPDAHARSLVFKFCFEHTPGGLRR